jgi:hypothetical protein
MLFSNNAIFEGLLKMAIVYDRPQKASLSVGVRQDSGQQEVGHEDVALVLWRS